MLRNDALGSAIEVESVLNAYQGYTSRLDADANDVEAALGIAELFMHEARVTGEHGYYFPAAAAILEDLLKRSDLDKGQEFMALYLHAGVLSSQHRFVESLTQAEKAISINPYNAAVRGITVDAFVELGHLDKAVQACDKMMAIRPDLKSYSRVSYLRELHGDTQGAIEAMKLAASAGAPGSESEAWCRTQLASLLAAEGQMEEAEYQLSLALEQRTDYPFALGQLADLRLMQDRTAEAEQLLNKAISIIPEIGFAEQLLAIYQRDGREEEAQKMTEEVLAMFEDDRVHGHIIDWDLAQFHAAYTADLDAALEASEKALAQRPEHSEIRAFVQSMKAQQAQLADR